MKSLKIFCIISLFALPNLAASANLSANLCRDDEGRFWVGKAGAEVRLCFFKDAAIGVKSLQDLKKAHIKTEAISAYQNGSESAVRGGVCGSFGAEAVVLNNEAGQVVHVCKFSDESVIEETTLWLGAGNNEALDKVLNSYL